MHAVTIKIYENVITISKKNMLVKMTNKLYIFIDYVYLGLHYMTII